MKEPNGAVTLTAEEVEGLNGLREMVARINKLGDIHPWLSAKHGHMTALQIASRADIASAVLVNAAVDGDDAAIRARVTWLAMWLIHLAGALQFDLLAAINEEAIAQMRLDGEEQKKDTPTGDTASQA